MRTKNIDEQFDSIFEPIRVVMDGREYTVEKIEEGVMEELIRSADNPAAARRGFARLVGVKDKEFEHTDVRKLALAFGFINDVIREQLARFQSKNAQGEGVEPTP